MNILIINHEFPPIGGGGGIFTSLLARGLSESGFNVFVLIPSSLSETVSITETLTVIKVKSLRFNRTSISNFGMLNFILTFSLIINKIIKKYNINIVNSHFIHTSGLADFLSFHKIPSVISPLGADIYDPTRYCKIRNFMNFAAKKILKKNNKIVLSSSDMLNRTIGLFPEYEKKCVIIPHCIDSKKYSPLKNKNVRMKLKISDSVKIIISVCRLVKRKNMELAIDIFYDLICSGFNIIYFIVGDGPEKENLVRKAEKLNILDKIFFFDYVDEKKLIELYQNSDIFLLPSLHEAFCIAAIESMACGVIPVCSNTGGWTDFIINNNTGYVCNKKEEYVDKIKLLLSDEKFYFRISENAYIASTTKYDYINISSQYAQLFKNILE